MNCLYFPYSRCIDLNSLKKALLLFDKIYFLDTLSVEIRQALIREGSHFSEFKVLSEENQKYLASTYNYLREEELIGFIDPTELLRSHDLLLSQNIINDLRNEEYYQYATGYYDKEWTVLRTRLPQTFLDSLKPDVMTFENRNWESLRNARHLRNALQEYAKSSKFKLEISHFYRFYQQIYNTPHYSIAFENTDKQVVHNAKKSGEAIKGKPFLDLETYDIPFHLASSIRITEALIVCLEKDLIPLTDSYIHKKLLTIKIENALREIKNNAYIREACNFDLHYELPKQDLALTIIDKLLPLDIFENMSFEDVVSYKKEHRELFDEFNIVLSKLAATINDNPFDDNYMRRLQKIIDKNVIPEINKIEMKMNKSIAKNTGKIIIQSSGVLVPVLYASILGGLSIKDILIACALGELSYLTTTGSDNLFKVVDKLKNKKSNSFSYLLRL